MMEIDKHSLPGPLADLDLASNRRLDSFAAHYHAKLNLFFRRRTRSIDEAADLTQDLFARLAGRDLRAVEQPGPFLYRMALNLLTDRNRLAATRAAARSSPIDDELMACEAPLQERALAAKQQLLVLEKALGELSERRRVVFVRCRFDQWSHQRIADELGISVSMVEKHVRKALLHCRRRLDEAAGGDMR